MLHRIHGFHPFPIAVHAFLHFLVACLGSAELHGEVLRIGDAHKPWGDEEEVAYFD